MFRYFKLPAIGPLHELIEAFLHGGTFRHISQYSRYFCYCRFLVELGGKRSRWRSKRNGQPQRNVLTHFYSTYTQTTSLYTRARAALCMQTTLLSLHRAHTLNQSRKHLRSRRFVGVLHHKPAPLQNKHGSSRSVRS